MIEQYVYLVSSGSYSDYRIEAIFDNEAAAEAFCAKPRMIEEWLTDDRKIEVFVLNNTSPTPGVLKGIASRISSSGNLENFRKVSEMESEDIASLRAQLTPAIHDKDVWAFADSYEQAFKVACDWWAQQKAQAVEGLPSAHSA